MCSKFIRFCDTLYATTGVDWLVLVESQAEVGQTDLKVESVIVGKHSQDLRKMQQRKMDVRWIFLAVTG